MFSFGPRELTPTAKEPVIITFWFNVLTKEAVEANEALTVLEEETAKEADTILFEPNGPNTFDPVIKDAVKAFEELITFCIEDVAIGIATPFELPTQVYPC